MFLLHSGNNLGALSRASSASTRWFLTFGLPVCWQAAKSVDSRATILGTSAGIALYYMCSLGQITQSFGVSVPSPLNQDNNSCSVKTGH